MNMEGYFWLVIALVLATVPAILFKRRFGIETQGPFCMWRTKKGLKLLDRWARYSRFWYALADLGLIFAFGAVGSIYLYLNSKKRALDFARIAAGYVFFIFASLTILFSPAVFSGKVPVTLETGIILFLGGLGIYTFWAILSHSGTIILNYLAGKPSMPGIQPLIPGVEIPGAPIYVPLIGGLIALVILIFVHEIAHGIVSRAEKIRVKSMGVLTAGIFPIGAFTEPDEAKLKRVAPRPRLRVFAVGSMANFLAAAVFAVLLIAASPLNAQILDEELAHADYLAITAVGNGTPAGAAGLVAGDKIYNVGILKSEKTPGAETFLETSKGNMTIKRDSEGYLGLNLGIILGSDPGIGNFAKKTLLEVLGWTLMLNMLVGIINFLPFAIFDGARIFEDLLVFYLKRTGIGGKKLAKTCVKSLTVILVILLVVNALPYFLK
jgi:membrane-associated protease RseP (regulator of RpoE activity)